MALTNTVRAFTTIMLLSGTAALYGQQPPAAAAAAAAAAADHAGQTPEPKLVFDRETYSYPGGGRRDPFKPLLGKESAGPLFEDLKLKGVIYTSDAARSVALIQDGTKRMYRLHRGDVIGNSRVVEIRPLAVSFAVENFGNIRNEVLELRTSADADQMRKQAGPPVPATGPMQSDNARPEAPGTPRTADSVARNTRDKVKDNNE